MHYAFLFTFSISCYIIFDKINYFNIGENMTIKEIAKPAGVSVSTVSKIMNGKDDSIRAETREHVLKIAKEYH